MVDNSFNLLHRSKEQHEACIVGDLFEALVQRTNGSAEQAFLDLASLVDRGLRLHAAAPGYCGHGDAIHKGDMIRAISKAKLAGSIAAGAVPVPVAAPVEGGATHENNLLLRDLYVTRLDLQEACRKLGISQIPWPDDEFAFYWEIVQKSRLLEKERDRIAALPTRTYDEDCRRQQKVRELNRQITELQNVRFDQLNETQQQTLASAQALYARYEQDDQLGGGNQTGKDPVPRTLASALEDVSRYGRSDQPQNESASRRTLTHKATEARKRYAKLRDDELKDFLADIEQRARAADKHWKSDDIRVTTEEFCEVAKRERPRLKDFSNSCIVWSVHKAGGSFMRGSKAKKNNCLDKLYPKQKQRFR